MAFEIFLVLCKRKGVPRQADVDQGVPGMLRPRIFLTFRHYKGGRSSAKGTDRLYPKRNPWYSLSDAVSCVMRGHYFTCKLPSHFTLSSDGRQRSAGLYANWLS